MLNGETCSITVTNERMPLRKRKNKERTYYLSYTLHGMQYNRNTKKSSWHNVLTAAQVGEIEAHVVGWVTQSLEDQKEEGDGKCEVAAVDSDMDVDGTAAVPVELTRFRVVAPASGRPLPPPPPPQRAAPPSVTRTPFGFNAYDSSSGAVAAEATSSSSAAAASNGRSRPTGLRSASRTNTPFTFGQYHKLRDYRVDQGAGNSRPGGAKRVVKYDTAAECEVVHAERHRLRALRRGNAMREAGTALLRAIGKGELSTEQHARVIEAGTGGAPIEFISDRRERQMIGELKRLLFELGHGDAVVLTQNLARFATFH